MIKISLPEDVQLFLSSLERLPFKLIIVGGTTRDVIRMGKFGCDMDVEVFLSTVSTAKEQELAWQLFKTMLQEKVGEVTVLNFSIYKVEYEGRSYEFSRPRTEDYGTKNFDFGHSDFETKFDMNLSFSQAIKRRDFTFNSLGLDMDAKLIDPCQGVQHLKSNEIKTNNPNFFKDPVRLYRLLRFSINFNLSVDPELSSKLQEFSKCKFSSHHLICEMLKCINRELFIDQLISAQTNYNIKLGRDIIFVLGLLKNLQNLQGPKQIPNLVISLLKQNVSLRNEELILFAQFFSISKKKISKLTQLIVQGCDESLLIEMLN